MRYYRVHNVTRGTDLALQAGAATESRERRSGLLGRTSLEDGEGLWIAPCEAVHMFFMKFAIDVVFLDKERRVVKVAAGLRPWRIAGSLRAHSALELPSGTAARSGTLPGDVLEFSPAS